MSAPHIILDYLPSLCQKLSDWCLFFLLRHGVDLAPSTRIHAHSSPANVFLDRLGIGVPTGH